MVYSYIILFKICLIKRYREISLEIVLTRHWEKDNRAEC